MTLNETQSKLCDENSTDFSDLKAVIFNTSLKKEEEKSHTKLLLSVAGDIMSRNKGGTVMNGQRYGKRSRPPIF